ncbi:uncharacterized protein I303_103967 [Kwoniella dejecticola CBS 10117]|uniref:WD40 repeat-like protein n=1 Tax=Kwoniella dejecticola CBS 10117 TaxID=1296121 RepID=A0AAJ8MGX9_9TREE
MEEIQVESLSYVDIQHDALAVFDDVEQGIILSEDIWISGYQVGETSVHGKAKVSIREGGGLDLTPRDGVQIQRMNKTQFKVSIPKLSIRDRTVKFPKQVINPPYRKTSSLDAPLHINSISLNPKTPHVVVGGQDGYCVILPTALNSQEKEVQLQGHVGDVLDVKWFPSGEVILTCSSDLSIRIYGRDGINPRTLKGHTRSITSTYIIGVGKEILSASKDGTIRLWDIASSKEVKRWMIGDTSRKSVEGMIVLDQAQDIARLGSQSKSEVGSERVGLLNTQDGIWVQPLSFKETDEGWFVKNRIDSKLISIAQEGGLVVKGYMNGWIEIMSLENLKNPNTSGQALETDGKGKGKYKVIRRNEASIYALKLKRNEDKDKDEYSLYVGTASGLPALLSIRETQDGYEARTEEELASWDAEGVEVFDYDSGSEGVWCAGGEGGLKRY